MPQIAPRRRIDVRRASHLTLSTPEISPGRRIEVRRSVHDDKLALDDVSASRNHSIPQATLRKIALRRRIVVRRTGLKPNIYDDKHHCEMTCFRPASLIMAQLS
ncbi:hypothetical protein IW262DRAFT_1459424 [Armillaria fumosa]|nr:hypothetical protein IW262DRAFT_1459424 [Armillaria fumosa]